MRKIFIMLAVAAVCGGCKTKTSHEEHEHEHEHHHAGEIEMSCEQQAEFGIETITLEKTDFQEIIACTGKIVPAAGDEVSLVAPTSGIITLAAVSEGLPVSEGSVIGSISGKGVSGGDDTEKAWELLQLTKREYERDAELLEDDIISRSHFEESKFAYEQAEREYRALAGSSDGSGGAKAVCPVGGHIKSIMVGSGDYVEKGKTIATISINRKLQVRAMVPEKYYSMLPKVSGANFTTSYSSKTHSIEDLGGRLLSYGRAAGEGTMLPVIFEFSGEGFIPGSYAEVYLKTSSSEKVLAVPVQAVVEDQGEHYVFVQHEEDAFLKKHVTLGQSDGVDVRILSGLEGGEQVVVKGAMQVKLAGMTSVPSGHNHQH